MSERRMFTQKIVDSDAFLDMPLSAQCLYFHLNMRAENKGFLNNPFSVARGIGASAEDIKTLLEHGYLIEDPNGVYITHWYENNGIGETARKRNNYRYREWRKRVLNRDKVCQSCGSSQNLEVHHIYPFASYPSLRFDDDNGIVLCQKCHRDLHKRARNKKRNEQ